jgi:PAS domain S-box-containing protein
MPCIAADPRLKMQAGAVTGSDMTGGSRIEAVRHGVMLSRCVGAIAFTVGVAALIGWQFDIDALKGIRTGLATMKANTAVAFMLAGTSLWLLSKPSTPADPRRRAGLGMAAVVLAIAVLTLAEYVFGWDLGIDQLMYPGRMSFNTALGFLLVASALLTLDRESQRGLRPAEWLVLAAALMTYIALLGYLYGIEALQHVAPYASMALHTAATLLLLCAGILFARSDRGLMGSLMSRGAGGVMGRRLLPAAILIPPLVGWLLTRGQQAGWYEPEFGSALLVGSIALVFAALIWRSVARINRVDAERMQAARELRKGQELLKAIIDNSQAVIYVKDLAGRYVMVNRQFEEFFRRSEKDVLGITDHDMFAKEIADAFRTLDQRVAAGGRALVEEEVVPTADGEHTYISVKAPLFDAGGEPWAIFGISTDITDRKRTEIEKATLLKSERAAREDAEAMNEVARALASELQLQEVVQIATDAATRLTGAQFGAFFYNVLSEKGESYLLFTLSGAPREAFEKFGLPRNTAMFEATFRGTAPVRLADVSEDPRYGKMAPHHGLPKGHPPVRSYLAVPVISRSGEVLGGLFFGHADRDVFTERAERMVLGIAAQSSIAIDNARLYLDAKQKQEKLQSQLGRLGLLDHITRAIGQRQDLPSILQVVLGTLEERLPIDFGCVCLYDASKSLLTVARVGTGSAPLAMELALTEQAPISIDENGLGRCVRGALVYEPDVSESTYPFPQRLARGGLRALVAAPLLVESEVFGVLIAARRVASSFSSTDCEFLRQLSEHVALAAHQAQLHGALLGAYEDLRQTQQVVLQQERLRAIGQMASGIAHDINNAISPASLYVEALLEHEAGLSNRGREHLETVGQAINDVAQTVTRLREFYRPREAQTELQRVDLNGIVSQVVDLTRARWSDIPQERGIVIRMQTELAAELPEVLGAETEIRDGLTNLIFNAVDAMPEGGTLSLRTGRNNSSVFIEVRDTGLGMDEETRRRCLEPFFTTKGLRGTGLGLAMVYGMVQRHDGDLEIDSELGKGTAIRVFFNTNAAEEAHAGAPTALPRRPAAGLRVLLVDDDPLLLNSLRDVLEADGHFVTIAPGGRQGIDTFVAAVQRNEAFAIVITDLGMPHIDGRKVAAAIHQASPATPIVLLTGWGQRLLDDDDIPPHVSRVLSKPPKIDELRATLAQLTTT